MLNRKYNQNNVEVKKIGDTFEEWNRKRSYFPC